MFDEMALAEATDRVISIINSSECDNEQKKVLIDTTNELLLTRCGIRETDNTPLSARVVRLVGTCLADGGSMSDILEALGIGIAMIICEKTDDKAKRLLILNAFYKDTKEALLAEI